MIATMREDVVAVVAYRYFDKRLVDDIMSLPAEERETYVHGKILNAVITSLPAKSPFTRQQLFEAPNNAMPGLQMQFSIAYHRLAYEKMETIRYRMETLMGCIPEDAHEIRGILEAALPEVKGAQQKHNSLERQYWEAYGHKINPLEGDWARRECIYNLQSTPEDQTPTSHDEPISANALGFRLGASTSQPSPCLLGAVTHGGGVDNQPPSVGVHDDPMQPGLIDFPDTTLDATLDLSLRLGYSLDDRVRLSPGCVGNELRRPSCDHVGFVGGSSTALELSTDSVRRMSDSSLHGHETVDSPRSPRRVKVFGVFLGPGLYAFHSQIAAYGLELVLDQKRD
ncbi:hypothetical protein SeMB42_g07727 [Synchytrium endobioticum]|uniref:Uncharacterized protein n=1 Tax=Synchytrium endobioticum TaxID=286115 RepID=A0A507C2A3_9FUNG|nr:hypothetical protein SeMB42_g07727 [Synchytrium endobioticum]